MLIILFFKKKFGYPMIMPYICRCEVCPFNAIGFGFFLNIY